MSEYKLEKTPRGALKDNLDEVKFPKKAQNKIERERDKFNLEMNRVEIQKKAEELNELIDKFEIINIVVEGKNKTKREKDTFWYIGEDGQPVNFVFDLQHKNGTKLKVWMTNREEFDEDYDGEMKSIGRHFKIYKIELDDKELEDYSLIGHIEYALNPLISFVEDQYNVKNIAEEKKEGKAKRKQIVENHTSLSFKEMPKTDEEKIQEIFG